MTKKWLSLFLLVAITCVYSYTNPFTEEDETLSLKLNDGVEDLDFLSELEKEVIMELNRARTDPAGYAELVEDFKKHYVGNYIYLPGRNPIITREGASAVNEAIEYLKSAQPVPPLHASRGLSHAARAHVEDQGPTGLIGHDGTDKSSPQDRIERFGKWGKSFGENINYGNRSARQIVMQLIIDDGIMDRGHRTNTFKALFRVVGVSCGPHHSYGHMCVMDFAGSYTEQDD
jgi:hypothetical protein